MTDEELHRYSEALKENIDDLMGTLKTAERQVLAISIQALVALESVQTEEDKELNQLIKSRAPRGP